MLRWLLAALIAKKDLQGLPAALQARLRPSGEVWRRDGGEVRGRGALRSCLCLMRCRSQALRLALLETLKGLTPGQELLLLLALLRILPPLQGQLTRRAMPALLQSLMLSPALSRAMEATPAQ